MASWAMLAPPIPSPLRSLPCLPSFSLGFCLARKSPPLPPPKVLDLFPKSHPSLSLRPEIPRPASVPVAAAPSWLPFSLLPPRRRLHLSSSPPCSIFLLTLLHGSSAFFSSPSLHYGSFSSLRTRDPPQSLALFLAASFRPSSPTSTTSSYSFPSPTTTTLVLSFSSTPSLLLSLLLSS